MCRIPLPTNTRHMLSFLWRWHRSGPRVMVVDFQQPGKRKKSSRFTFLICKVSECFNCYFEQSSNCCLATWFFFSRVFEFVIRSVSKLGWLQLMKKTTEKRLRTPLKSVLLEESVSILFKHWLKAWSCEIIFNWSGLLQVEICKIG